MSEALEAGGEAIMRAKYKLRQAEVLLICLRDLSKQIALAQRRASSSSDNSELRLNAFFFACLGLAQSAFYIIDGERGYKKPIRDWRTKTLNEKDRARFNKMTDLRGRDVHYGQSDGKMLSTMIPMEPSGDWVHQNYSVAGVPRPVSEHTNPDGGVARSHYGLQSSMGFFVEIAGETVESSNACAWFIEKLGELIAVVEARSGAPQPEQQPV